MQRLVHEHGAGCLSLWGEMKDFAVCQTLPNPRQLSPDGPTAESGFSQMVPRGTLAPRGTNYSENILRTLLRKHCGCVPVLYLFLPVPCYIHIRTLGKERSFQFALRYRHNQSPMGRVKRKACWRWSLKVWFSTSLSGSWMEWIFHDFH